MKVLVHGSQLLYPTNTGGRIRTSKLFEKLSKHHDITWVCLRRPEETDDQVAAMRACCARIETFPFREVEKFSPEFYRDLAQNFVSPHPFNVQKYFHSSLRHRVAELLEKEHFDLLLCDFLQPSLNVLDLPFSPRILFQHNVESMIFERHYRERKGVAGKAYLYYQWRKLLAYEGKAARWFNHNIMVSDEDCRAMERLFGVKNVSSIPTGVDADYFRPGAPGPASAAEAGQTAENDIVFTGSMDWLPNVDGITWFANDILPLVQREVPVRVWVVGRKPLAAVSALASKNAAITVTGTVDDVRPYMARSKVYMVPLRIGGGTRMKIYEAMAMAMPVVSTSIGAEGLPVHDGKDVVLADDAPSFARSIVQLLGDPQRRRALGAAGRRLTTENFSWDVVARRFAEICESVVEQRMRGAA
jgi:polysaccharide biosynthesis protein PslH